MRDNANQEPTYATLSYQQASPQQVEKALAHTQQALQQRFPMLSLAQWKEVFVMCQPDLVLERSDVQIEYQGLTWIITYIMTIYVNTTGERKQLTSDPISYCPGKRMSALFKRAAWAVEHWYGQASADRQLRQFYDAFFHLPFIAKGKKGLLQATGRTCRSAWIR